MKNPTITILTYYQNKLIELSSGMIRGKYPRCSSSTYRRIRFLYTGTEDFLELLEEYPSAAEAADVQAAIFSLKMEANSIFEEYGI